MNATMMQRLISLDFLMTSPANQELLFSNLFFSCHSQTDVTANIGIQEVDGQKKLKLFRCMEA